MTTSAAALRLRKRNPVFVGIQVAGAVLWLAGIGAGISGMRTAGIVLRVAGLALCTGTALRRSSLLFWTLLAMPIGVELGIDVPHVAAQTRFLGDLFLRLVRMIVAPLLFATITTGIAGHGQLRSIGRVAVKALIYFEVVTTLGLIIGAIAMQMAGAGWGVSLAAGGAAPVAAAQQG